MVARSSIGALGTTAPPWTIVVPSSSTTSRTAGALGYLTYPSASSTCGVPMGSQTKRNPAIWAKRPSVNSTPRDGVFQNFLELRR